MKFADRKGGFPHSEISGSRGARASPELIAACHVLHRLSTPRHPSEALMRLIVLSKTHAWGRFARPRYETRTRAHTCALSLPDNDVFHQVSPPRPCGPGKPFHSRCQNLNPAFAGDAPGSGETRKLVSCDRAQIQAPQAFPSGRRGDGGARRDRTDDLMLAKHALYQLSYGPLKDPSSQPVSEPSTCPPEVSHEVWWAQADSNCRPHAYQACALTS